MPNPAEAFEREVFLPPGETECPPDPLAAILGEVERSIEQMIPPELDVHADAVSRALDLADFSVATEQNSSLVPWPSAPPDVVGKGIEDQSPERPRPETEAELTEDRPWFHATPSIAGGGAVLPADTETVGGPPRPPFGVRPPRARPFGGSTGLRTIGDTAGVGPVCWCPIHNQPSSPELCEPCRFYGEDPNSETGWRCNYYDGP